MLTETHLGMDVEDARIGIPGYTVLRRDRAFQNSPPRAKRKRSLRSLFPQGGGGVLVYVRDGVVTEAPRMYSEEGFEMIVFTDKEADIRYNLVYRKPSTKVTEELLGKLADEAGTASQYIVLGDLNMNTKGVKAPAPRNLHTTLRVQLKLEQQVKFITRCKIVQKVKIRTRGTTIDHVWAKRRCRCSVINVLSPLSDHEAIRIKHNGGHLDSKRKEKYAYRRAWKKVTNEEMERILAEEMAKAGVATRSGWKPHEPDHARMEMAAHGVGSEREQEGFPILEAWERAWARIKEECAPKKRVRVKDKPKLMKVAREVRDARVERNRLHRQASKEEATPETKLAYKRSCRKARRLYNASVKQYVQKHWKEAGDKPLNPAHWKLLNALAGRKVKEHTEPGCTPDRVNDTFVAKPAKIREPLLDQPGPRLHQAEGKVLLSFRKLSDQDAIRAVKAARTTHSVGVDEVPMSVLKRLGQSIAPYVAALANEVIGKREWPEAWKRAEVHPLWKRK
eukprot:gene5954-biopygen29539